MTSTCTLQVRATPEGHTLLLQLMEMGLRLYHTGQARDRNFNLYAQMEDTQWKRVLRLLPSWVYHSEKLPIVIRDERSLRLRELRWDFKEGERALSAILTEVFMDKFSPPLLDSLLLVRFPHQWYQSVISLANTTILYTPILPKERHSATQWLRRHHIPYALTHLTQETLQRFIREEQEVSRLNEDHRIQQAYREQHRQEQAHAPERSTKSGS